MNLVETKVSSALIFKGHIIEVRLDQITLPDGNPATREVAYHPGGVAVLPLHEDGTVTVVRQYRYPFSEIITEIPAGKLDKGEPHQVAALRELEEETGCVPGKLTYLGATLASPGFTNERLHMYLAQDLSQVDWHPDEDEFLERDRVPFATLVEQVLSGEIEDGKTVAAVLKTKIMLNL